MSKKLSAKRKAQMGLDHLVSINHIQREDADTILKGVVIAKAPVHMTMVFAATYLSIGKETHMKDVIDMAQQFERPININWSKSRWEEAHNDLSRIATLKALSGENYREFNVDHYADAMPEGRARQTIIRNSTRLGFESKRQRHCIASYANRCASGDICICSVVVDGKRWTVQLTKQGERYFLSQIKSVLNSNPPFLVQMKIEDIYLPDKQEKGGAVNAEEAPIEDQCREAATLAREHNIVDCYGSFSGGGDSGQFDSMDYHDANGEEMEVGGEIRNQLDEYIEAYVYSFDENWWDGSGGNGRVYFNFYTMEVELEINQCFEESTTAVWIESEVISGLEEFAIDAPPKNQSPSDNDVADSISESEGHEESLDNEAKTFVESLLETGVYTKNAA